MRRSEFRTAFVEACLDGAPAEVSEWTNELAAVCRNTIEPHAADVDRRRRYPWEGVEALRRIGAFGINIPRSFDGLGFGSEAGALAIEMVASACASTAAVLMFHAQVSQRITDFGSDEQRTADLPQLASGETVASSAWTEPGCGPDKSNMNTRLSGQAPLFALNGQKTYCTGLEGAGQIHVLVSAPLPGGALAPTFVRIRTGAPGVDVSQVYDLLGLRGSSTGVVRLEAVDVRTEDVVGEIGSGMALMQANHKALLNPGLLAMGIGAAAFREITCIAGSSLDGAEPASQHQSVRLALAEMELSLTAVYATAAHAIRTIRARRPSAQMDTYRVKALASAAASQISSRALQLAGSRGFNTEWPVERHFRDAQATSLMGPSTHVIQERLAGHILSGTAAPAQTAGGKQ